MALRMKRLLLGSAAELRYEPYPLRVRATVDGLTAVESTRALLVWEPRRLVPVYAVPTEDLHGTLVEAGTAAPDEHEFPPFLGPDSSFALHTTEGRSFDVVVGEHTLERAAFAPDNPVLEGHVTLDFGAFERWYLEGEELLGHARDPYKRIDTVASDRHVVVAFEGQVLADSRRPVALYETHLPVRWYLPREDVRTDLLEPGDTRTTCAYKGHASYLSLRGAGERGRDLAWYYPEPLRDAEAVRDMVCFWSERTDLTLDDVAVPRPVTPWSPPEDQREAAEESLEFG
jgi:uncharacterized protein (DUF427 family)